MNYRQYRERERELAVKYRLFRLSIYIITIISFVQEVLIFTNRDLLGGFFRLTFMDMISLLAKESLIVGNTAKGIMFHLLSFSVCIFFLIISILIDDKRRYPFILSIFVYGIDTILCFFKGTYFGSVFHVVLIVMLILTLKNMDDMTKLNKDIWG